MRNALQGALGLVVYAAVIVALLYGLQTPFGLALGALAIAALVAMQIYAIFLGANSEDRQRRSISLFVIGAILLLAVTSRWTNILDFVVSMTGGKP